MAFTSCGLLDTFCSCAYSMMRNADLSPVMNRNCWLGPERYGLNGMLNGDVYVCSGMYTPRVDVPFRLSLLIEVFKCSYLWSQSMSPHLVVFQTPPSGVWRTKAQLPPANWVSHKTSVDRLIDEFERPSSWTNYRFPWQTFVAKCPQESSQTAASSGNIARSVFTSVQANDCVVDCELELE